MKVKGGLELQFEVRALDHAAAGKCNIAMRSCQSSALWIPPRKEGGVKTMLTSMLCRADPRGCS